MKKVCCSIVTLFVALFCFSQQQKLLLFSKTAGFHHGSIPAGIEAITKLGASNNFAVDTTTDASLFTKENLARYKALIFLSTTGDLFDDAQQTALQNYVENGGGIIGVHAATDAEYNWPWYGQTMGAYFESHPKQQQAKLKVVDASHPATKGLPSEWTRFDEWYNFKNLNSDVHVLLQLDETSYEGGKNGSNHPAAWWYNVGKGRIFYTTLGHTNESYTEPLFLQHLTGGILSVLQRGKK